MSLTTTTLSAACAASDTSITVASATGFAAGQPILVGGEVMATSQAYVAGSTKVAVRRGLDGTVAKAHPITDNVITGPAGSFALPAAQETVTYPIAGRARIVSSYSATGAIALPPAGSDAVAVLNGTTALDMSIAAPTTDMDGCVLTVVGNGAAAHVLTYTGGLSGASGSYNIVTVNATAPTATSVIACNGAWVMFVQTPMAGTVTNITNTLS